MGFSLPNCWKLARSVEVLEADDCEREKGKWGERVMEWNFSSAGRWCWSILEKAGMQAQEMPMVISTSLVGGVVRLLV